MLEQLGNFFYDKLVNDPEISQYFPGDDWLYYYMAPQEAGLPRVVHNITEGRWYSEHGQVDGLWDISIYTAEPTTLKARTVGDLIKRKFSNVVFTNEHGLATMQLWLRPGSSFVGTGDFYRKRMDLGFEIRYSRTHR